MAFIGNQPTAVPLTSSQLADGLVTTAKLAADAVTSAKIADSTIVNADIASTTINLTQKVTGTLPATNGGTGVASYSAGNILYASNATTLATLAPGTSGHALTLNGTTPTWSAVSDNFSTKLLHVRDEKASGTAGGTFTSGSFQTRTLNTSVTNEISGASLSSNQITLPSGTYFIFASAPAYATNQHKLKLRNTTDSSDTLIGTSEFDYADTNVSNRSFVIGRFTIASQKTFELQHRCETTRNTDGFGVASSFSVVEVYADCEIWKVA